MQNLSKHKHALLALAIVSTLVSGQALPEVQAADSTGKLDGSFGTGGISDVGGNFIVVEPNGTIYAAGGRAVARLHSNGTLDGSFGTSGFAINDNDAFFGTSVAVGPDGAIVMAGLAFIPGTSFDSALTRFLGDGTLDVGFGTGGTVIADVSREGLTDVWNAVAVQRDGKIVVAGDTILSTTFDSFFTVARYNTDGTLDTSFGTGGIVTSDLGGSLTSAFSVAIQPDGKIVAAGTTFINDFDFAVARYNSDGTLDASFGTDGAIITDFAGKGSRQDRAFSVVVQPDGKIVAAGQATIRGFDFGLARYNRDGTLDASFGSGGTVTTSIGNGSFDFARSVALQPNGKIVAAGQVLFTDTGFDFALTRYERDGTLDAGFGTGGIVTTDFPGFDFGASSVGVQPNGKIVVAGGVLAGYQ